MLHNKAFTSRESTESCPLTGLGVGLCSQAKPSDNQTIGINQTQQKQKYLTHWQEKTEQRMLSGPKQRLHSSKIPEHRDWSKTEGMFDQVPTQWAWLSPSRERTPQRGETLHPAGGGNRDKQKLVCLLGEAHQCANTAAHYVNCCNQRRASSNSKPPWTTKTVQRHWITVCTEPVYTCKIYCTYPEHRAENAHYSKKKI